VCTGGLYCVLVDPQGQAPEVYCTGGLSTCSYSYPLLVDPQVQASEVYCTGGLSMGCTEASKWASILYVEDILAHIVTEASTSPPDKGRKGE